VDGRKKVLGGWHSKGGCGVGRVCGGGFDVVKGRRVSEQARRMWSAMAE
jgi:hypothetical protein